MECKIFGLGNVKRGSILYIKGINCTMVKLLSFLVFLFTPIVALAGSVSADKDTNITLYGTIKQYFVWGNGNNSDDIYPANSAIKKSNFTKFQSYSGSTKLGADIESDKVSGKIESDFEGNKNTLILLKAYASYKINDNLSLLIGKDDPIGELNTFSDNYVAMPGFNKTRPEGVDQVKLTESFDIGSTSLQADLAAENVYTFMFRDEEQDEKGVSVKMPGIGAKLSYEFPFLQQKSRTFIFFETQKVYFDNDQSHWPYVCGIGANLPIKSLTLQGEFLYGKGSTHYVGLIEAVNKLGISTQVPRGYTDDGSARRLRAYNIEANLALNDTWSIYGGYDKVNFMNKLIEQNPDPSFNYIPNIQSSDGKFVGVAYNLTKSTTLRLEYDNFKTYWYCPKHGDLEHATANQVFLSAQYDF